MLNLLYYLPMNFIGIFMWKKIMGSDDDVITKHMSKSMIVKTVIGSVIAVLLYWQFLNFLGGNLAIIDAVTTVAAVLAMYLQVTRYTESWIVWSAYLMNSTYGYINWKKLERNVVEE